MLPFLLQIGGQSVFAMALSSLDVEALGTFLEKKKKRFHKVIVESLKDVLTHLCFY